MPQRAFPVILFALAAPVAAVADAPAVALEEEGVQLAQLTIRERIVIRVPMAPPPTIVARPQPIRWKESRGPRCIPAQRMAGALISAPNQVDLVLLGGRRVRAKLERACRPLDFYSGFYVRPAADGMICAERDAIRVRSGASCGIDRFRLLQPAK